MTSTRRIFNSIYFFYLTKVIITHMSITGDISKASTFDALIKVLASIQLDKSGVLLNNVFGVLCDNNLKHFFV